MYDDLKTTDQGQFYSGMRIGGTHQWHYQDGIWREVKETPDRWGFHFDSVKRRHHAAPTNTGAQVQTKYHWYIIADQVATKLDNNSYFTEMQGVKYKIGHQRPHWQAFSYEYPGQVGYRERIIAILEQALRQLKGDTPTKAPSPICITSPPASSRFGLDYWISR